MEFSNTSSNNIAIIVSCRLSSKRLPNKALEEINEIPSIERCLINCKAAQKPRFTVLATTSNDEDSVLSHIAKRNQVYFFQGNDIDVLTRYVDAADKYNINTIIRVTGDSPLVSYELIDYLVEEHLLNNAEFTYVEGSAIGIASEVIDVEAMKRVQKLTCTKMSEYMSFYFKWNPKHFRLHRAVLPKGMAKPELRLTLDEEKDLILLNNVFNYYKIGRKAISWLEIIRYFTFYPEDKFINQALKKAYREDSHLIQQIKNACIIESEPE